MATHIHLSGMTGGPSPAPTDAGGCCSNQLNPAPATPATTDAAPCCGTQAEAAADSSCCGRAAKADAVTAGRGCCG